MPSDAKRPKVNEEPEVILLVDSDDEEDAVVTAAGTKTNEENSYYCQGTGQDNLLAPLPPATIESPFPMSHDYRHVVTAQPQADAHFPHHGTTQGANDRTEAAALAATGQWRCTLCTYLNEASASKCGMCNDDDSNDGGDLAKFLVGTTLLEGESSNHSFGASDAF